MCPICHQRLSRSVYRRTESGRQEKSCPSCSKRLGRHVYYPVADFGERNMGNGNVLVQSWCGPCRGNSPSSAYDATC